MVSAFQKAGFDVATVMGLYAPARTEPRIAARLRYAAIVQKLHLQIKN
jgi:hypothetical protein